MAIFFCKKKERIIFGKAKPMEDVSLEEFQKNPIWTFALDEENNEEQDETWLKPILSSTDVTSHLIQIFLQWFFWNRLQIL